MRRQVSTRQAAGAAIFRVVAAAGLAVGVAGAVAGAVAVAVAVVGVLPPQQLALAMMIILFTGLVV